MTALPYLHSPLLSKEGPNPRRKYMRNPACREQEHSTLFAIQDDGHRPVVHELDLHVRAELAGRHRQPLGARAADEMLVERNGVFRTCRIGERWPPSFRRVGEQGELRDGEELTVHIAQRLVELPTFILVDP